MMTFPFSPISDSHDVSGKCAKSNAKSFALQIIRFINRAWIGAEERASSTLELQHHGHSVGRARSPQRASHGMSRVSQLLLLRLLRLFMKRE